MSRDVEAEHVELGTHPLGGLHVGQARAQRHVGRPAVEGELVDGHATTGPTVEVGHVEQEVAAVHAVAARAGRDPVDGV